MVSAREKEYLRQLAQAASKQMATEQLLILVAVEDGLLDFCRKLVATGGLQSPAGQMLAEACRKTRCPFDEFLHHIQEVLRSLDVSADSSKDAYAILGLPPATPLPEVKRTFRQLSLQYHPDHAAQGVDSNAFIEIHSAYKTILADQNGETGSVSTPWRHLEEGSDIPATAHKKFFATLVGVVAVLLLITFVLTGRKNSALLQQNSLYQGSQIVQNQPASQSPAQTISQPEPPAQEDSVAQRADFDTVTAPVQQKKGREFSLRQPLAQSPLPTAKPLPEVEAPKSAPPKEEARQTLQPVIAISSTPEVRKIIRATEPQVNVPPAQQLKEPVQPVQVTQQIEEVVDQVVRVDPEAPMSTAPEEEVQQEESPLQVMHQVKGVVDQFVRVYQARDVEEFYGLFSPGATENDQPLLSLRDRYESLFRENLVIQLKILNMNWQKRDQQNQIRGSFVASYFHNTGDVNTLTGALCFTVIQSESQYKISRFDYTLEKTK